MLVKSIRWRIQVWHGALLSLLVAGMLATFFIYERSERAQVIDDQLSSMITPLLPRFVPPGGPDFGGPGPERGRSNETGKGEFAKGPFYYVAWSPEGDVIAKSAAAPDAPLLQHGAARRGRYFRSRENYRELVMVTPEESGVLVGVSTAPMKAQIRRLAAVLVGVGAALIAFGLIGGWWVAGHVLRPISHISETAEKIAGGDRSRRIVLRESDSELGKLATVLNRTFDKLDRAFEQQVRFTADASHELRTPVSVILTQTQLALARERSAAEYQQTLATCERSAVRMRTLVNSLLELARMDSGELNLNLKECDVAKVAATAVELVAPLASQKSAVLRTSIESVAVRGDAVKLGHVLVNLLQNAIQHNSPGVEICLTVQRGEDKAFIRVSDNGAGIPAESLPHIFARFYRVDTSRSGSNGGTGLGLAISKAIVEAHGGTINVESKLGESTVFLIVLPGASSFTSS